MGAEHQGMMQRVFTDLSVDVAGYLTASVQTENIN